MATWHAPLAERYRGRPEPAVTKPSGDSLHLVDLSATARRAYRGGEAASYLAQHKVPVTESSNYAARLTDGSLAVRLGPSEVWLVAPAGTEEPPKSWPAGGDPNDGDSPFAYPTDRTNSHAQFALVGREAPDCLARLCGVDLHPRALGDLGVVQSSVARVAAVILRADAGGRPTYHLFVDRASAVYFWDCLAEAAEEFDYLVASQPA